MQAFYVRGNHEERVDFIPGRTTYEGVRLFCQRFHVTVFAFFNVFVHIYTSTCDQPLHRCNYRYKLLLPSAVGSKYVLVQ